MKQQGIGSEKFQSKFLFWGMILVAAVILIPLFWIAHYNFMSVDDFGYAAGADVVWEETHSVWKAISMQWSYAWSYWKTWQGTVTAEWITTSLMAIFAKDAYYMGTYLSLGGFAVSEFFLFLVIFKRVFGAKWVWGGILALPVICLQILLTPVPVEAFFWFCGATLYALPYAGTMLLTAILILYYNAPEKCWKRALLIAVMLLLTFLVSMGTYISLIGMLLVYCCAVIWYWYRHNPGRWIVIGGFVLYLAGFLADVLAPGNQIRMAGTELEGTSAAEAVFRALYEALCYIGRNTIPPCIIVAVLLAPVMVRLARGKQYRYPWPVLVTLISYGVFAAQFVPTLYSIGMTGAGRVQNIYRWTFYIWLYGNEMYWIGWLMNRDKIAGWLRTDKERKCLLLPGWIAGGLLLLISLRYWGGDTVTTYSAVQSLRTGQAQGYYEEWQERLVVLEDETVSDAVLKPFSHYAYLLYFGDITTDPDDWVNYAVASYYGKNSVVLETK